jgi:broad specificity phosphatase PhoE
MATWGEVLLRRCGDLDEKQALAAVLLGAVPAAVCLLRMLAQQEVPAGPAPAPPPPPAPPPAAKPPPRVSFAADDNAELDLSSTDEEEDEEEGSGTGAKAFRPPEGGGRPTKLQLMSLGGPATYSPPRFADALECAEHVPGGSRGGSGGASVRGAGGQSKVKFLTLLRHGQALHNVNAEAMRASGCTFEQFIAQMKRDDVFDAPLTQFGREQAATASTTFARTLCAQKMELVVSSPLTRAIATVDVVLPQSAAQSVRRRVVREEFRERCGMLLCGKRQTASALAAAHPPWEVTSHIVERDELWTEKIEKTDATCRRAYAGLLWLWEQPERHICVAGHGGIFDCMLKHHPHIIADADMSASFANCELRTCRLTLAPHCDTPHPGEQANPKLTFKMEWVRM